MNVTIYSKPDCNECTKAKMLLSSRGVNYTELRLNEDFTKETLAEMFPSARSFPIIVVDGFRLSGYTELDRHLLREETLLGSKKFLTE